MKVIIQKTQVEHLLSKKCELTKLLRLVLSNVWWVTLGHLSRLSEEEGIPTEVAVRSNSSAPVTARFGS